MAGKAEPEDVDGDTLFDDIEVSCGNTGGMAAIAADYEVGIDPLGTVGSLRDDSRNLHGALVVDEACGLPTHAEREIRELGGLGGEEVEEVPLRHEGNKFACGGEMPEVGDGEGTVADVHG